MVGKCHLRARFVAVSSFLISGSVVGCLPWREDVTRSAEDMRPRLDAHLDGMWWAGKREFSPVGAWVEL